MKSLPVAGHTNEGQLTRYQVAALVSLPVPFPGLVSGLPPETHTLSELGRASIV